MPGPLPRLVEATTEELHTRPQGHCSQLSPQLPLAGLYPGLDGWMDGCMDGPTQSQLQIFTNFTPIVCLCDTSPQGPGGEHTAEKGATPRLHPRHQDLRGRPSFFPAKLVSLLIFSLVLHFVDLLEAKGSHQKLDGVGLVDNRPSTHKLHQFVPPPPKKTNM